MIKIKLNWYQPYLFYGPGFENSLHRSLQLAPPRRIYVKLRNTFIDPTALLLLSFRCVALFYFWFSMRLSELSCFFSLQMKAKIIRQRINILKLFTKSLLQDNLKPLLANAFSDFCQKLA